MIFARADAMIPRPEGPLSVSPGACQGGDEEGAEARARLSYQVLRATALRLLIDNREYQAIHS